MYNMNTLTPVIIIILSYLIGAIPFGLYLARCFGVPDIRKVGSGNIGATNVWRNAGGKAAALVFFFDIGKGALAVIVARMTTQSMMSADLFMIICGMTAVLGHVFPVYLKFRGGKGVNTALGVVASLMPFESAVAFVLFAIVVAITKYVSVGSMVGALSLPISLDVKSIWLAKDSSQALFYFSIIIALLVLVTHRTNIGRLINGDENKFSFSSRSKGAGTNA